ncbi:MAG: hypothetical protein WBP26_03840 [Candidatus Saccharimonadales bacterium]
MFKKQKKQPDSRRVVRTPLTRSYGPYATDPRRPQPATTGNQVRHRPDDPRRGVAQEERDAKLKKVIVRRRFVMLVSVMVVALLLAGSLYLSGSPKVVMMQSGDKSAILLHSPEEYQAAAGHLVRESFANYNKVTIDSNTIEEKMLAQFPELASVRVRAPVLGTQPIVVVTPREPLAVLQTSQGGTFVIDSGGIAVREGQAPSGMDLLTVVDQTRSEAAVGKRVLPATTMRFINKLAYQLAQKHIATESFILPAQAAHEIDVRVVGAAHYIKFSAANEASFNEQIGSFLAMQEYMMGKGITPKEYVDVRLPGRAYYK